jgi:hypothetical protein
MGSLTLSTLSLMSAPPQEPGHGVSAAGAWTANGLSAVRTVDSTPGNLRPAVTSFIGRESDIAEVQAALRTHPAGHLDRAQLLDLRYAIAGVAISGVGAVLSLCT